MKLTKVYTTVKSIEEYEKVKLILEYYSKDKHKILSCTNSRINFLFTKSKVLFVFINDIGQLGCIPYRHDAFNLFKHIFYEDLIKKY